MVLHAGSVYHWTGIEDIVASVHSWPADWVLVVHTRFDATGGRDKFVYLSVSGDKVQIAYGTSPKYTYPLDAKNDQPFEKDVQYELTIRAQGR